MLVATWSRAAAAHPLHRVHRRHHGTGFFHRDGADDTKLGANEKDDPAEIAKDGFEALMAGKDHVVAGSFKNKLMAAAGHVLPDPLMARAHAAQSAPGSANEK